MTDHERGQVDTSAAEIYDSLFVPALFGRFAGSIAEAARITETESVVDVACGTGALTHAVRRYTSGRVVGVDISPAMIAVARRDQSDVEFAQGDATDLDFAERTFDVAVSQFGLMFLDNPSQGVAEMARVARRGLVAVWDSIDQSEGYSAMQDLFRSELGDDAASSLDAPFAMGHGGVLEGILETAHLRNVEYQSIPGTGRFESIDQWVTTEVRGWTLSDSVTDEQLADLVAVAEQELDRFATDRGCEVGMKARIATWVT